MTNTDQQHDAQTDEQALVQRATEGDVIAFDELNRRHAAAAWNLARAVTSDVDDARAALAAGVGQTYTAQRAGRDDGQTPFRTRLLTHTHDAAVDRVRARTGQAPTPRSAGTDPHLSAAFSDLPHRWRGPLWLHLVDELDDATIASVARLAPGDVTTLLARARAGLVERYLHTPAVEAPARNCRRAVSRLTGHLTGTLPAGDGRKLERHLSLCEPCTAVHARLATLGTALPTLALALPDDAREPMRAAWTAAVASGSATSAMSARAEKVLAGVSAFAAAVGVLGAALFAVQDRAGTEPTASAPIAPLVERVATPRPFDITGGIAFAADRSDVAPEVSPEPTDTPAADPVPEAVPSLPRTDSPVAATSPDEPIAPVPEPPIDEVTGPVDELTDQSPVPVPEGVVPDADVSLEIADQPVEVDLDDDPNVTVGPISTGSDDAGADDTDDEEPVETDASPEPTEPVVEAVNETVTTAEDSLGL